MKLAAMTRIDALSRGVRRSHLGDHIQAKGDMISRAGHIGEGLRYQGVAKKVNAGALSDLTRARTPGKVMPPSPRMERTIIPQGHQIGSSAMPVSAVKVAKGFLSGLANLVAPGDGEKLEQAEGMARDAAGRAAAGARAKGMKVDPSTAKFMQDDAERLMGVGAARQARNATAGRRVLYGLGGAAVLGGAAFLADRHRRQKLNEVFYPSKKPPLTTIDEAQDSRKEDNLRGDGAGYDPPIDAKHASGSGARHASGSRLVFKKSARTVTLIGAHPKSGSGACYARLASKTAARTVTAMNDHYAGPEIPQSSWGKVERPKVPHIKPFTFKTERPKIPGYKQAGLLGTIAKAGKALIGPTVDVGAAGVNMLTKKKPDALKMAGDRPQGSGQTPAVLAGWLRAEYRKIATDAVQRFMRSARTNGQAHTPEDMEEAWRLGAHTQPRSHKGRHATVKTRVKHLGGKSGPAWSSLKKNVQARLPMGTDIPGQKGPDALAKLRR